MNAPQLHEVSFDEQDANLFEVPDPRLRADALKHSILPRLHVVLNEAAAKVQSILRVDPFEDSTVSYSPHFRPGRRQNEVTILYDWAYAGLGGKRTKGKWYGVTRKDGKPAQIVPFRLGFYLLGHGLGIILENGLIGGIDSASFNKLLNFHLEHESLIATLCFESGFGPQLVHSADVRHFSPLRDQYRYRMSHGLYDNHYFSHTYHFPVREPQLWELIRSYVWFFPVYDSYIQIAKGQRPRFLELLECLNSWIEAADETAETENASDLDQSTDPEMVAKAAIAAESRIAVMPAMRWQVLQRDQWKCVACGRGSHDGVILHVDHIVPRSRGGTDGLGNYQTLCSTCNLGKGNRDSTDLRGLVGTQTGP